MKLRFYETCRDKYTDDVYECGVTYDFDDERAKEILATGKAYKIEVVDIETTEQEEPQQEEHQEVEQLQDLEERLNNGEMVQLSSLSKDELIEMAKSMDVAIRGTKEDIIERILEKQTGE